MEVTCKHQKKEVYPQLKIGKQTGTVVLFHNKDSGTVLYRCSTDCGVLPVGAYSDTFNEASFMPFTGEVTLKN